MNKKKKIKKLLHARIDVWVDSLGDAITVEDACLHIDHALRMCNAMIRLQAKLNTKRPKR